MNHQFEVVPLIAARCQASTQRWDIFIFFYFPTVGGRLTSSERTFIKRTHESAADTFKDVVKMWSDVVMKCTSI